MESTEQHYFNQQYQQETRKEDENRVIIFTFIRMSGLLDCQHYCTEYTHINAIDSSASVEQSDENEGDLTSLSINTALDNRTEEITNEDIEVEHINAIHQNQEVDQE